MAALVATRGTCARRKTGCVLVSCGKRVLATGYNGRPSGFPHCDEGFPCPGADAPSGTGPGAGGVGCQDGPACEAIHAEQNALLQCDDVWKIDRAYLTLSPCLHCAKMLLNTSTRVLVFSEMSRHSVDALRMWVEAGREWVHLPTPKTLAISTFPWPVMDLGLWGPGE